MHRRSHPANGFTLVEILVVVVIIGILSALLAPNFVGGNRGREMRREATTLAATIRLAQDEAMLYGVDYGLVVEATGYRFVAWDPARYRFREVKREEASWAVHALPEDTRLQIVADANADVLTLPPSPEDAVPADGVEAAGVDWQPVAFVLSSGEVTPFTAVFLAGEGGTPAEVRIDPLGNRIEDEDGDHAPAR